MLDLAKVFYAAIALFVLSVISAFGTWYIHTSVTHNFTVQQTAKFIHYDLLFATRELKTVLENNLMPENTIPSERSVAVFRKLNEQYDRYTAPYKRLDALLSNQIIEHNNLHQNNIQLNNNIAITFLELDSSLQALSVFYEDILKSIEEKDSPDDILATSFTLFYERQNALLNQLNSFEKALLEQATQAQSTLQDSQTNFNAHLHYLWLAFLIVCVVVGALLLCIMTNRLLRYFSTFFYSYPGPLFTFDVNGKLINCNKAFKEVAQEFMYDPVKSLSVKPFIGSDWQGVQQYFRDFIDNKQHSAFSLNTLSKPTNDIKQYFQLGLTVKNKQDQIVHYRIEFTCIKVWFKTKALCRLIDNTEIMNLKQSNGLDPFTQLLNKPNMLYRLSQEIDRAKRQKIPLSLLFIDIDEFKKTNDEHGHAFGDKVLKRVAKTIKQRVRDTDVIGRFGGDEFIVVCPDCSEAQANAIAITVKKLLNDNEFSVSLSIGITEMGPNDDVDALLERADQALYHSKRNGKNRVSIASELML